MSGLIHRLYVWSWAQDWRTWLMHFLIVGLAVLGVGLLGGFHLGFLAALYAVGYYHGRETLWEGGVYTADRLMDAASATAGAGVALVLIDVLRGGG